MCNEVKMVCDLAGQLVRSFDFIHASIAMAFKAFGENLTARVDLYKNGAVLLCGFMSVLIVFV
jgi:hypothetical protein